MDEFLSSLEYYLLYTPNKGPSTSVTLIKFKQSILARAFKALTKAQIIQMTSLLLTSKKEHLWVLSGRNIGYSTSWDLVNLSDSSRAEISRRRPIVSWQMARWFATIWSSIFTTQCSLLQILLTKNTDWLLFPPGYVTRQVLLWKNSTNNKNLLLTKLIFARNAFLIVMASTHVDKSIKPIYDQNWFSHLKLLRHAIICFQNICINTTLRTCIWNTNVYLTQAGANNSLRTVKLQRLNSMIPIQHQTDFSTNTHVSILGHVDGNLHSEQHHFTRSVSRYIEHQ